MRYILKLLRAVVDLLFLMALALSAIGFMGWRSTTRIPSEASLVPVEGRVASVREVKRRRRPSALHFRLSGHSEKWVYSEAHPNYLKARFRLIPGARVRLWALAEADRWQPRIWRLEVSGTTIATFQMMEVYSIRNGRWGLALCIGFLSAAAWLGWANWQGSRADVILRRWSRERRRMQRLRQRRAQLP